MNKNILFLVGGIIIVAGLVLLNPFKKNTTTTPTGIGSFFKKEITVSTDICGAFPKEFVEQATAKKIVKTEDFTLQELHTCKYFVDETDFVTLRYDSLSVENQKKGQQTLGRSITTNPKIKMEHFVVVQGDGLINEVVLVLNPNLLISVDRSSTKAANEEEIINFAVAVADRIQSGQAVAKPTTPPTQVPQVPQAQGEDVVRNFLSLISEGKISDAVNMMVPRAIADDSQKQAWGVQLNAFKKLELKKIEPAGDNMYQVTLDVEMKPEAAGGPIPFYGYENGENIRWIGLEKVDNVWKVTGFATGP